MVTEPSWRDTAFNLKGMPQNPRILQRQELDAVPGKVLGDADIVLFERDHPSVATAIEVKRIKAGASAFLSGRPTRLGKYEKAVQQANRLADVGFAQVYLFVFVVVDSRQRSDGRQAYEGLTPELRCAVRECISTKNLAPDVGLVVHEFLQCVDHPPRSTGGYTCHLERLARTTPQASAVTEWIARLR